MQPKLIPQLYPDESAVLFATGPSLTEEVVSTVEKYRDKVRVFGCNDSYRIVPFLDVHYACDPGWWNYHYKKVFESLPPDCHVWTQDVPSSLRYGLNLIRGSHENGIYTRTRNHIHYGSNSGYQLLNLAYHYGIRKFFLCGYDMRKTDKGHFFGKHPKGMSNDSPYPKFVQAYDTIQPEIKHMVINCTPKSAINAFRKGNLEEELSRL